MLRDLGFKFTVLSQQRFTFECFLWIQHEWRRLYRLGVSGVKSSSGAHMQRDPLDWILRLVLLTRPSLRGVNANFDSPSQSHPRGEAQDFPLSCEWVGSEGFGDVASLGKTSKGKGSLIIFRTKENIIINDDTAILYHHRSRCRYCSIGDHRVRAY
jgi:hypothetical protein